MLRTAIELADKGGIDSLTMRKLAHELGVEAMSLYYYVTNKNDLLKGIVDIVVGEVEVASRRERLESGRAQECDPFHDVSASPLGLQPLMSPSGSVRAHALHGVDTWAASRAGFSANRTHHEYHAGQPHHRLDARQAGYSSLKLPADAEKASQRPSRSVPYLASTWTSTSHGPTRKDVPEFEFGLDLILDGPRSYEGDRQRAAKPSARDIAHARSASTIRALPPEVRRCVVRSSCCSLLDLIQPGALQARAAQERAPRVW